jgi:hypothetical protein
MDCLQSAQNVENLRTAPKQACILKKPSSNVDTHELTGLHLEEAQ